MGWLGSIDLFCYICCESRVLLLLLPWGQFRRFCYSFLHKVSACITDLKVTITVAVNMEHSTCACCPSELISSRSIHEHLLPLVTSKALHICVDDKNRECFTDTLWLFEIQCFVLYGLVEGHYGRNN